MSIESRIDAVKRVLERIHEYKRIVEADNFEPATIDDIKGNAKDLCDTAKTEIDNIKAGIDDWG